MPEALVQEWLETEAGWGHRPDGYSVHLSDEDRVKFCTAYWERMPARDKSGRPPAEYSREDGDPIWCEISDQLFAQLQKKKNEFGIRLWRSEGTISKNKSKTVFIEKIRAADPFDVATDAINAIFTKLNLSPDFEAWGDVSRWRCDWTRGATAIEAVVILLHRGNPIRIQARDICNNPGEKLETFTMDQLNRLEEFLQRKKR